MTRIAFYPCCAGDIREPALALAGIVDEIIYCDISRRLRDDPTIGSEGPKRTFWRKDMHLALEQIPRIDVFFYRRDGVEEGGSGIYMLGRHVFPKILARMANNPGLIITDGSNARGNYYHKMRRNSGLVLEGKHVTQRPEQRFTELGVLEFEVRNVPNDSSTSHVEHVGA